MTIPIADASGTKEINHHKEIPIIGSTGIAAYTSQDNKFPNTIWPISRYQQYGGWKYNLMMMTST